MDCLNHWIPAFAGMTTGASGFRRAATGLLGGLFPTPPYHGSVFVELSRTAELAERPASMQAYP